MKIGGEVDEVGEELPPSIFDMVMHSLSFPWKVLFSFIPPTEYWGGWAAFFCSLVFIGIITGKFDWTEFHKLTSGLKPLLENLLHCLAVLLESRTQSQQSLLLLLELLCLILLQANKQLKHLGN